MPSFTARSPDNKTSANFFSEFGKRNFALSIGPQRAGTSWLDKYLRLRGDVCLPQDVKEVFFFDRHYDRGPEFYSSHFKPLETHHLAMEVTTTAFDNPDAPRRVYEMFGKDITLICPLRHPVIRTYSLYLHYLRYGIVSGTLRDACFQHPQVIDSSKYAQHIKNWLSYFSREQIHFVFQEDLDADQGSYITQICMALGIPYMPAPSAISDIKHNASTYSRSGTCAWLAQCTADWLRQNRLYFLINAAKSLGLKNVVFGGKPRDPEKSSIPERDRLWLEDQFKGQVAELELLIGPVGQWR